MRLKGQITIFEAISVVIILFVAFNIFFPGLVFKDRWGDAQLLQKARDILIVAGNLNVTPEVIFNSSETKRFVDTLVPQRNLIVWANADGAIQPRITVACNCTVEQIANLTTWVGRSKVNGRNFDIDFSETTMETIQKSDVLIIWGDYDEDVNGNKIFKKVRDYQPQILNYIGEGNGVIYINDFSVGSASVPGHRKIFGIETCGSCNAPAGSARLQLPASSSSPTYQIFKNFYGVPLKLPGDRSLPDSEGVPIEPGAPVPPCSTLAPRVGNFSFRNDNITYWICWGDKTLYFDVNKNGFADRFVRERQNFNFIDNAFLINNFPYRNNFTLNYVDGNRSFVSFKQTYNFTSLESQRVGLTDGGNDRYVFVQDNADPFYAMTVNMTTGVPVIWMEDFSRVQSTGNKAMVADDKKSLIAATIIAAANKHPEDIGPARLRIGATSSYLYTNNTDVFESYLFNLGLGYPY